MEQIYRDFEYIDTLVLEFLGRKQLRKSFEVIAENEITGWEIWFQIEFARFLADHPDCPEWQRERRFEFDYRRERTRSYLKPDFIIRKKGTARDRFIALEVKQHVQLGNCVVNMLADLTKVGRIRSSQLDLRSYWALGIFQHSDHDDPLEVIQTKLTEYDLVYHHSLTKVRKIGYTRYSYALLPGLEY